MLCTPPLKRGLAEHEQELIGLVRGKLRRVHVFQM